MARILFLGFISIIHKRSKDATHKYKNLKAIIYYKVSKTILQNTDDIIALLEYTKDDIKLVSLNGYKRYYHLILVGSMVDYNYYRH